MVTLYQPDGKWLTDHVYSPADLLLVCVDGRVPVHSALLAGSSPLLASLLADHGTCAGCLEPICLYLEDTALADCNMLVSLLYSGLAQLRGPGVDHVLSLAAMLGLHLPGLQVQNADASLLVCDLPLLHNRVPVGQGRVVLPGCVLQEVLDMKTNIKVEAEEDFDPLDPQNWTVNCPKLEGNGRDSEYSPIVRRHKANRKAVIVQDETTRNFVCQNCNSGFRFARSYRWHREKCKEKEEDDTSTETEAVKGRGNKIKTCKICGKSFIGKSLKMHYINLHFKSRIEMDYISGNESSKECPICRAKFKKRQGLTTHIGYVHRAYVKYLREHENATVVKGRKVSCGECKKCKMENCGKCAFCQDKPEFGGPGKLMKVCVKKVCRNKRISEAVIKPTLVRKNFIERKR